MEHHAKLMESLVATARVMRPTLRDLRGQIDEDRAVPGDVVRELAPHGFFGLLVPRELGGVEASSEIFLRAAEELAIGEAATGWCSMVTSSTSLLSAYMPQDVGREVFGELEAIAAGVFAPFGRARKVDGGYRVTGRWPYASACKHADWITGGALAVDDAGKPTSRSVLSMLFRAEEVDIIDTWHVLGLRGTGSHDIAVDDVFVPDGRVVNLLEGTPRYDGAVFRIPPFTVLATGVAGVALGIARAAIDEFIDWASDASRASQSFLQIEAARAEASLRAVRAGLYQAVRDASEAAQSGPLDLKARALVRLAATGAAQTAARVVDAVYNAAGGAAIWQQNPFERHLRDARTASQHIFVSPRGYSMAGKVLMGIDEPQPML